MLTLKKNHACLTTLAALAVPRLWAGVSKATFRSRPRTLYRISGFLVSKHKREKTAEKWFAEISVLDFVIFRSVEKTM